MDYISGWCKSKRRLDGYTAIVTGGNAGLGKETVQDFYLRGAQVIIACRNQEKGEETKTSILQECKKSGTGTLIVEKLDLASLKSVRDFASRMLASDFNINILVNNAGVMCCPQGKTEDGFETHIGTNHFGHALLTLLLLPRLIKSAPSRIVFVSSYVHNFSNLDFDDINYEKTSYNAVKAYSRSKAANVLFPKALAMRLKEHGIDNVNTYSLHPGVIITGIIRYISDSVYGFSWLLQNIISWFLKSARCGAQTAIYCAIDEQCAQQTGLYYYECALATPSRQCRDENQAEKLWDLTIEMLELENYNPFQL